jgi:hypothetical protein
LHLFFVLFVLVNQCLIYPIQNNGNLSSLDPLLLLAMQYKNLNCPLLYFGYRSCTFKSLWVLISKTNCINIFFNTQVAEWAIVGNINKAEINILLLRLIFISDSLLFVTLSIYLFEIIHFHLTYNVAG